MKSLDKLRKKILKYEFLKTDTKRYTEINFLLHATFSSYFWLFVILYRVYILEFVV